jgi:hypothetical protein
LYATSEGNFGKKSDCIGGALLGFDKIKKVIPREPRQWRGLRRDYTSAPNDMSVAYIQGLLHDATWRRGTLRIAQKSKPFLERVRTLLAHLGCPSWIYREGRKRRVYILEFSKSKLLGLGDHSFKSPEDKIDYVRGYFDAEGGIAKSAKVRFYIYFAQKNLKDLERVRNFLTQLGIGCGRVHNPSRLIDPKYFRFYVSTACHRKFAKVVGSLHPEKAHILGKKI